MKEEGGGVAIFRAVFDSRNSTKTLATQAIKVPRTPILIFSRKRRFFFSVLAFRPHVNGIFGNQKRRFSKTVPTAKFLENANLSFSWGRMKRKSSNTIMLKLIQISYLRTRIFFENGEGKSPDTSGRGLTDSFVVSELQEITASSSLPVCLRFLVFSRPMPRKRPQCS